MITIEEICMNIVKASKEQVVGEERVQKLLKGRKEFTLPPPPENCPPFELVISVPQCTGCKKDLPPGIYLVGRSRVLASIQLTTPTVSVFHDLIEVHENGIVTIQDLGSTNGTSINDAPLESYKVYQLHQFDTVFLGESVRLMLH